MNLDTFIPLSRLPTEGENLTLLPGCDPIIEVPGGKGCNQAIACSKLLPPKHSNDGSSSRQRVAFVGQIGNNDSKASILTDVLTKHRVDLSNCERCIDYPAGNAYVFLQKDTGKVSAVISGGSNLYGWRRWKDYFDRVGGDGDDGAGVVVEEDRMMVREHEALLDALLFPPKGNDDSDSSGIKCLLLQREIPECVNLILARHIRQRQRRQGDIIVLQDIGGEERPMSQEMMSLCDYIMPNHTELKRLVHDLEPDYPIDVDDNDDDDENKDDNDMTKLEHQRTQAITLAKILQKHGATNVLVTLGRAGSVLLQVDGTITTQTAIALPSPEYKVVDETGAGDCYRAAFAVALTEQAEAAAAGANGTLDRKACMMFASAAGALAVTKEGAVPSIPSREEVETLLMRSSSSSSRNKVGERQGQQQEDGIISVSRGGDQANEEEEEEEDAPPFPFMFGSRINSMKDRPDLHPNPSSLSNDNVREWVRRQSQIKGLGCVDFNYPQHFHTWTNAEAKAALDEAGLVAGAVCLRYPSKFARGAMNHPEEGMRKEAVRLTKEAADTARQLGCNEVVVWSAYDGYDYPFQVDYNQKWEQLVQTFQECCDEYPDIRWSLEFKPTDENTRFFTVPSTGAAMLLINEINRPNMGLTLDIGHILMSGENPGQSIAMVGERLFCIQLNDGYTRLAAEDGMMFGSIHPTMALEAMYQLQKIDFKGHLYFDTFPQRSDPVKEAEFNIRQVKKFWKAAERLDGKGIRKVMDEHDAIGALNLCNLVLKTL